ncbi:MAG: SAM-dependent methyltransferase [Desertimonas sp.]
MADGRPDAVGPAGEAIRRAIAGAGGRITFQRFMSMALYGTDGFYAGGGRAGRRGDFLTSPEVGPLFGAVLARYLDAVWDELGRPAPFDVVEVGAGPGTLARTIQAARPAVAAAGRYLAVETSAAQRARHPEGVISLAEPPAVDVAGVVLANELLDNLPFRLVVFDGAWREAMVADDGGRLVEVLGPPLADVPAVLPTTAPLGARAALQEAASEWVTAARALLPRGRVLAIDYTRPTTSVMSATPWREWLRTYAGHRRGRHYLADPGGQDITVDVALDQLPHPDRRLDQAAFLRRWGIEGLVAEGNAVWAERAASPDLRALTMRSRAREAEALLDVAGLGGFDVLEWSV